MAARTRTPAQARLIEAARRGAAFDLAQRVRAKMPPQDLIGGGGTLQSLAQAPPVRPAAVVAPPPKALIVTRPLPAPSPTSALPHPHRNLGPYLHAKKR